MSEQYKEIVRRYFEPLSTHDVTIYDEIVHPDVTFHGMEVSSVDDLKEKGEEVLGAFPDMRASVDLLVEEDDLVAARGTFKGTHTGEFEGIPITGKTFEVTEVDFFRIDNGKIAEVWHLYDSMGMMQQLGLMSEEG